MFFSYWAKRWSSKGVVRSKSRLLQKGCYSSRGYACPGYVEAVTNNILLITGNQKNVLWTGIFWHKNSSLKIFFTKLTKPCDKKAKMIEK